MAGALLREHINQPTERFPRCHCSTIVELPSGDLLTAWYAGSGEAKRDVAVVSSRREKGAGSWGEMKVISDTPGKPEGNCVLFVAPDGVLWVFFAVMHGKLDGPYGPGVRWVTCDLRAKTSTDEGRTWSETRIIREELGMVARCKPIVLDNGDIIMGFEHKQGFSYFMISPDDGRTWQWTGPLRGVPNEHPTLIQRENGDILAMLRPSFFKRIARAVSHDRGRTWEHAVNTEFPNPGAAIDMVKLEDGRVVLVFNDSWRGRNPLTLAMSEDEGETWPHKRDLVTGEGSFAYPAIIQDAEGLLHVTYTNNRVHIDHVVVEPDWIKGA
jgi:predicted neuraminidase